MGDYPWAAYFKYQDDRGVWQCTASLISSKYLLTAAHCTNTAKNIRSGTVRLGIVDYENDGGVEVNVKSWHPHEKYDFPNDDSPHDISVLKVVFRHPKVVFIGPGSLRGFLINNYAEEAGDIYSGIPCVVVH